jgi:RNA polymerase sigma-70 factor (ECF subfamily)
LAGCALGDAAALAMLFDRHHGAVCRFLARLSDPERGYLDDLAQATFIRVGQSAGTFAGRSSVRSWILAIAGHVARDHTRAEVRRRRLVVSASSEPQATSERPDQTAEGRETLVRFGAALAELPDEQRVAFVMCELEDVPGKDAAAALGVPEGTLWRRLHDARRSLMRAMATPTQTRREPLHDRA